MKKVVPPIIRFAEERADARAVARTERNRMMSLLRSKFGPLPADVTAAVEAANSDKIERLFDAVLTANTLADMPLFHQ